MRSWTFGSSDPGALAVSLAMGFLGALGCSLIELFVVLLVCSDHFAGLWELQWGSLWHLPQVVFASGVLGALGALLGRHAVSRNTSARVASALAIALLLAAFAYGVTFGRHFEPWWRRLGVIALFGIGSGFLALRFGPSVARIGRARPRLGMAVVALSLVTLELINRLVLVRLYPGFHLALAITVLLVSGAVCGALPAPAMLRTRAPLFALSLLFTAGASLPFSAPRLSRFDNYLWVLGEQAPIQRELLVLTTLLAPADPMPEERPARTPEWSRTVSFEGRSILLITIDALRADHVGAYGYKRPTTPFLDELAARGARFEYAYSATPHTSYSITSLMTGKYIRPLLLQGAGADSETWAQHLRRYGYKTAAFFPPAVFFIDTDRFTSFDRTQFGFEYVKREFLEGEPRALQVEAYLAQQAGESPVFVWVHLFGPHEPYEAHPEFPFGDRDVDRYDGEIAFADATARRIADAFLERSPDSVVIVTADHGEEFGEHGGRYHGSTVYEEQVRVPLLVAASNAVPEIIVKEPVQTIDLLPTVLCALSIPTRPRIRGRDLGPLLNTSPASGDGFAYAETERQSMLAKGPLRLLCERRVGACRLFDIDRDPAQRRDVQGERPQAFAALRAALRSFNASHGRYERAGQRAEGKGWPPALTRALAGDDDAVLEVSELLDDADVEIRRKAAELLFRARRAETAPSLRLSVQRDEDAAVRNYAALALERLGQGASITTELLRSDELRWQRLAALALAEQGDARGAETLARWWQDPEARDHQTSLDILAALAKIRAKDAAIVLSRSLDDVRLRPAIARALAEIGSEDVRGSLASALSREPYQGIRAALAEALVELGADNELISPLRRWLGVPDPLEQGLGFAERAGILEHVGGPSHQDLARLRENANLGELITVVVPKGGNGQGVRILVEAENPAQTSGRVLVGKPLSSAHLNLKGTKISRQKLPQIHPTNRIELEFEAGIAPSLRWADAPEQMGLSPGRSSHLVVFAQAGVRVRSLAALPRQDEIATGADAQAEPSSGNGSSDENP